MSADVQLNDVWIRFGSFVAVRDANLIIEGGEFFSFLGPSGCGKTTLLRAISGFQEPSQGRIMIGGENMAGIGPNKRPTALIFQNLALFPLMTVWENISFALEVRGASKAERRKKADELLELIALPDQGDKMVRELSGGQRQRVAIARALAAEPKVLLLDEPLSALDLKLRQHMRTELRAIQQQVGITFIYITHDQGEALTMSDRVAVMSSGIIEQVGDGSQIYDHPETAFVASFVGENNAFPGTVTELDQDTVVVATEIGPVRARQYGRQDAKRLTVNDDAIVFVRPESLRIAQTGSPPLDNQFQVRMTQQEFEGNLWQFFLQLDNGKIIKMSTVNDGQLPPHSPGSTVTAGFQSDLAVALPKGPLAAE